MDKKFSSQDENTVKNDAEQKNKNQEMFKIQDVHSFNLNQIKLQILRLTHSQHHYLFSL